GTAPINTSRTIPPKLPATNDSTRIPKRSSRRLTATSAPLMANTKVPPRSSTRTKVSIVVMSAQPGQGADHHCLGSRCQGGVQHRRECRAVIDRQLIQPAFCLGAGPGLWIGTANEPVHGGCLPGCAEAAKILARRCRPGMADPLRGEMATKRLGDTVAGGFVIDVQRVAIERRDLRFAWRSRCFGLGIDDAFYRGQHMFTHAGIKGTHVELDNGLIRDDVFL